VKWYPVLKCTGLHTGKDLAVQMMEGRSRIRTVFILQLKEIAVY
jgi:hypothetical protein